LNSYYSYELRVEFERFIPFSSEKLEKKPYLQKLKLFCEEMKFHIYQKGLKFGNCQDDLKNLSDFLFLDHRKTNILDPSLKINERESEEAKLNTSNYYHSRKFKWRK